MRPRFASATRLLLKVAVLRDEETATSSCLQAIDSLLNVLLESGGCAAPAFTENKLPIRQTLNAVTVANCGTDKLNCVRKVTIQFGEVVYKWREAAEKLGE